MIKSPEKRIDEPRLERGTVMAAINGKTPVERKRIKRDAFLAETTPGYFEGHGYGIEIVSVAPFGEDGIEIDARVFRNGDEVPLGNLLPFRIVNPPILVPDGTKATVDVPFGDGTTRRVEVDNYREDVSAALEAIVVEHVRAVMKK